MVSPRGRRDQVRLLVSDGDAFRAGALVELRVGDVRPQLAVAADVVIQREQLDCRINLLGGELGEHVAHQRFVFANQATFPVIQRERFQFAAGNVVQP